MPTPPDFTNGTALEASSLNSVGLWKVASQTLSGTATNIVGCFTDDYRNYRIVIESLNFNASGDVYIQLLTGTTPETAAAYFWAYRGINASGTAADNVNTSQTFAYTGCSNIGAIGVEISAASIDVYSPKLAQRTFFTSNASGYVTNFYTRNGMMELNSTTAYDGIRFLTIGGVNVTGQVRIYGYRN
jgi:hypothetical protein